LGVTRTVRYLQGFAEGTSVIGRHLLLIAAVIACCIPAVKHVLAVDACLDSGRVFDYRSSACRSDLTTAPVPHWSRNPELAGPAIGLVAAGIVAAVGVASRRVRARSVSRALRWGGAAILVVLLLLLVNTALASIWAAGGPPTSIPLAWRAQASRASWLALSVLFLAIWLPVGNRSAGLPASVR
jgi:hypothetical protein